MDSFNIKNSDGIIKYWTFGSGDEAIIFTHGAAVDHNLFKHQVEYFAKKYKVITWDAPCHGESRPFSWLSFEKSADLILKILNREGLNTAHLVGHSMGGFISQHFYFKYPSMVSSITTIGSFRLDNTKLSNINKIVLKNISVLLNIIPTKLLRNLFSKLCTYTIESKTYTLKCLNLLTKDELIFIISSVYKDLLKTRNIKELNCPLLITCGEFDTTVNIKKQFYNATMIPYSRHNANFDNYNYFNETLYNFLKNVSK